MKRDEFNSIFENVEYTDEFKQKMEKKLSSPNKSESDEYIEAVSGVEADNRSRIVHWAGAAAACAILVGSCIGIGLTLKNQIDPVQPEPPVASGITTTGTAAVTTTAETPQDSSHNLSDIDEETAAQLRKFLTEADRNCYLITSPYVDFDQYYDTIHGEISMEELEEQGLAFFGSDFGDGWYYRVTNGKSEQELLDEHHSYFTKDYYDNFDDIVTERDGVAYVTSPPADYYPFHDFEASADEITIKSQSDTEVVIEVAVDCTEAVVDYYQYNKVNSPLPEGYKYTYPQEVVLVNTEDGWRISDYIPYSDFRMRSLYDCPEMQEYIGSEGNIIYNPIIEINPEDFIGIWRVDGDEYGYELNVISADDTKVVFELSSYRSFSTSPITAEILCGGSAYFSTLGDDDNINIEGNLSFNTDGTIYLEITSSESSVVTVGTCITFNTKVQ